MKGGGTPTGQLHKELQAGLVLDWGLGAEIPRKFVNNYIMEATGVGLRQSVNRYLEAWEDMGLIEDETWMGRKGVVKLLQPRIAIDAIAQQSS